MFETIQSLIEQEGQICVPARHLTPRANLYELGMTPYTAIRLLLAIEREFRIEFPRESLNRQTMADDGEYYPRHSRRPVRSRLRMAPGGLREAIRAGCAEATTKDRRLPGLTSRHFGAVVRRLRH